MKREPGKTKLCFSYRTVAGRTGSCAVPVKTATPGFLPSASIPRIAPFSRQDHSELWLSFQPHPGVYFCERTSKHLRIPRGGPGCLPPPHMTEKKDSALRPDVSFCLQRRTSVYREMERQRWHTMLGLAGHTENLEVQKIQICKLVFGCQFVLKVLLVHLNNSMILLLKFREIPWNSKPGNSLSK